MSGPGSVEAKFLKELQERQAQIQNEVFTSPPADWAGFQYRAGQWEENQRVLARFSNLAQIFEEDEGK